VPLDAPTTYLFGKVLRADLTGRSRREGRLNWAAPGAGPLTDTTPDERGSTSSLTAASSRRGCGRSNRAFQHAPAMPRPGPRGQTQGARAAWRRSSKARQQLALRGASGRGSLPDRHSGPGVLPNADGQDSRGALLVPTWAGYMGDQQCFRAEYPQARVTCWTLSEDLARRQRFTQA
jgi:hypothetical protein